MSKECNYIKELLPLYKQNILTPETTADITEHLSVCPTCQNHGIHAGKNYIATGQSYNPFRKYHKVLRILKTMLFLLLLLVILLGYFLWKFLYGGLPDRSTDLSAYQEWSDFQGYSGLFIFPDHYPADSRYYYYYSDELNPRAEIWLYSHYSEESFHAEVNRLQSVSVSDSKGHTNSILLDTDSFLTDAYVAEYNWRNCYEYALIFPETHTILYVYLQNMDIEELTLHEALLPHPYPEAANKDRVCIYAFGYNGNLDHCVLIYE